MSSFNSKIIKIDSSTADIYLNSYGTKFITSFDPITVLPHQSILYSLQTVNVPYSYYSVNQNNQYLDLYENVSGAQRTRTIIIPQGNYSATQYQTVLLSLLNSSFITYTMSYNIIQNKYTIGISTPYTLVRFLYHSGTNASLSNYKFLGFRKEDIQISTISNVISTNAVVMSDIYYLQLKSDLGNVVLSNQGDDLILEIIPIPTQPFSFIHHKGNDNNKFLLSDRSLSHIMISLLDNNNNEVDLNGVTFHITIKIDIVNNDDNKIPYSMGRPNNDNDNGTNQEPSNTFEMIKQQPTIIQNASLEKYPMMSNNDFIDLYHIQEMIADEERLKRKSKYKKNKI